MKPFHCTHCGTRFESLPPRCTYCGCTTTLRLVNVNHECERKDASGSDVYLEYMLAPDSEAFVAGIVTVAFPSGVTASREMTELELEDGFEAYENARKRHREEYGGF